MSYDMKEINELAEALAEFAIDDSLLNGPFAKPRASKARRKPDHVAKSKSSDLRVLNASVSETVNWRNVANKSEMWHLGRRFIVGGMLSVIIEDHGDRVRVLRANGTEITPLKRSVTASMYKDRASRIVVK